MMYISLAAVLFWGAAGICFLLGVLSPVIFFLRWQGGWRFFALFPVLLQGIAYGMLFYSMTSDVRTHSLWPFEVALWGLSGFLFLLFMNVLYQAQHKKERDRSHAG